MHSLAKEPTLASASPRARRRGPALLHAAAAVPCAVGMGWARDAGRCAALHTLPASRRRASPRARAAVAPLPLASHLLLLLLWPMTQWVAVVEGGAPRRCGKQHWWAVVRCGREQAAAACERAVARTWWGSIRCISPPRGGEQRAAAASMAAAGPAVAAVALDASRGKGCGSGPRAAWWRRRQCPHHHHQFPLLRHRQ